MRNRQDRRIMSAISRQRSIELFDVEFVDFVRDHAPVAQIDASLGERGGLCAETSTVFVTEGATQSRQVSLPREHYGGSYCVLARARRKWASMRIRSIMCG